METFFVTLRKSLVATIFLFFVFAATYIPQDWNQIERAEAAGGGNFAQETTQWLNNAELVLLNSTALDELVQSTITAAQSTLTAVNTAGLLEKEFILDGLAWAAAKAVVQAIVNDLVAWIQSGFQGRPAFVEDLSGFLLETADIAAGDYIQDLGGIGSFICSPFQLDIQIALDIKYDEIIRYNGERPISTCSLSGIVGNIEDYFSGLTGSFDQGGAGSGWENWAEVTSDPDMYTPYGQYLVAEAGLRAKIINAKGEELDVLNWGEGFLSSTLCETVHGATYDEDNCFINKPGKIIQEALTFNVDSGRQSLVTADEIDEIIAALLQQLATTILTGAQGLFS